MAVKTDTLYKTLKKNWTVYRINIDDFTASVYKEFLCTEEEIERERRKLLNFTKRNDHPSAFVYRECSPRNELVIPVL